MQSQNWWNNLTLSEVQQKKAVEPALVDLPESLITELIQHNFESTQKIKEAGPTTIFYFIGTNNYTLIVTRLSLRDWPAATVLEGALNWTNSVTRLSVRPRGNKGVWPVSLIEQILKSNNINTMDDLIAKNRDEAAAIIGEIIEQSCSRYSNIKPRDFLEHIRTVINRYSLMEEQTRKYRQQFDDLRAKDS